jgi:hypothetical protein
VSGPPQRLSKNTLLLNRTSSNPFKISPFPKGRHLAPTVPDWGKPAQETNMTHFTQLGLSGSPDKKPETKTQTPSPKGPGSHSNEKPPTKKQKTAALAGSLIATALLGVFVFESGCSKESAKTSAIAPPNPTVASQPTAPIATVSTTITPATSQPLAKKKSRQRKLTASTYSNPTYGVSFRYPKYDNLKEGDDANLELDGLGPVEMNFVQPGGTTITAVELPSRLYGGTNFDTAFFNVSVNPRMTAEDCEQFAFPETADTKADPVTISKTRIGPTEFHAVEAFAETESNEADVKFYHVFQNGSCYEFTLGLETASESSSDEPKPGVKLVDGNEVFRQLNWMLSTVKIQPIAAPGKITPEVATDAPTAPTSAAMTEAH